MTDTAATSPPPSDSASPPPTRDATWDALALLTPEIDAFCSASAWQRAAHAAFAPQSPLWLPPTDAGLLAFAHAIDLPIGPALIPLEAQWLLGCSLLGPDRPLLATAAADLLLTAAPPWRTAILSGLSRTDPLLPHLARALRGHATLRLGPPTRRHVASLAGGLDGWLSRRSPVFRKRARQSQRLAHAAGLTFTWHAPTTSAAAAALFARALAVEARSWKGRAATGFASPPMATFYAAMFPDLAQTHGLRVLFAHDGPTDVAVCFGGLLGSTFRGLQNSFDDTYRPLSLGNLMQIETIRRLTAEPLTTGPITAYDLGSEMDYKHHFAETLVETITFAAVRT